LATSSNSGIEGESRIISPPSTIRVWPVMKLASAEARKMTAAAISAGVPLAYLTPNAFVDSVFEVYLQAAVADEEIDSPNARRAKAARSSATNVARRYPHCGIMLGAGTDWDRPSVSQMTTVRDS
jgi:hypothetical protein